MIERGDGDPDAGDPASPADQWVFDEAFIAGGVKESSLRRLTSPPPRQVPNPRGLTSATERALNAGSGPRDWSPTPARRSRRPRHWQWWLAAALSIGITLLTVFARGGGGGGGAPAIIVQPKFTPAHSPVAAPPSNDPKNTASTLPSVTGLTPSMPIGTCFDLSANNVSTKTCATLHEYQLVAIEAASGVNSHYPSETYWRGPVIARCTADLVAYAGQPASRLPRALQASEFKPTPKGWAVGDRVVYCVAEWHPSSRTNAAHLPVSHASSQSTAR